MFGVAAKGPKRKHWLESEDKAIVELVQEYGIKQWTVIAKKMKKRYAKINDPL